MVECHLSAILRCSALKEVQTEHPSYRKGAEQWWSDVIWRTAIGAGCSKHGIVDIYGITDESLIGQWMSALDENLSEIVKTLMVRFSSKEGYKAFDDAISTSQSESLFSLVHLLNLGNYLPVRDLHDRDIRTAVVSNGDSRIRGWHLGLSYTRHSL